LKNKLIFAALSMGFALFLLVPAGCKKESSPSSPGRKPGGPRGRFDVQFPVEVAPVTVQSLVYSVFAVGSVDAFEKVQVTARVAGVVDRVLFAEGRMVSLGQELVEIEPERYKLAVEAAQASYDKALASKADAEAGLKRRETVIAQTPGLIPGEEVETWRTKVSLAVSDVALAQAALNQAKLNLRDAYVRAPFSGMIETRTVQTGEYVQVGTTLATLVRRDPLLLRFKVSERDAARMRSGMKVTFKIREDTKVYDAGIVFIAGAADEGTRMVSIAAEVRNAGAGVRPGSFAEITVPVSAARNAPVIPQTAVRPSERGFIAYVLKGDKAVERVLSLGMRTIEGQVEVLSGLNMGETLVIRGAEALRDGAPVKVISPAAGPAAKIPGKR
jgi:RND family efflux transporter MFP subunit